MSHIWMSHVSHMIHVAHMHESCLANIDESGHAYA